MVREDRAGGTTHRYLHRDRLNSVTAITDESTGYVLDRLSYEDREFENPSKSASTNCVGGPTLGELCIATGDLNGSDGNTVEVLLAMPANCSTTAPDDGCTKERSLIFYRHEVRTINEIGETITSVFATAGAAADFVYETRGAVSMFGEFLGNMVLGGGIGAFR